MKDIQSFLSFANFYRHFIYNYLDIVVPLTHLTQKDAPWNFSTDCRHSFNLLKEAFTSTPILTHYQPNAPIIVETDASDYAIAGILSNICPDSEIHLVAFSLIVATVTTRDSRRPKMHTKPTQRHASECSAPQQNPSEQCEHARYLSLFLLSPFSPCTYCI